MNKVGSQGFQASAHPLRLVLALLWSVLVFSAGWTQAQQSAAATAGNLRLFPAVAAPGEQVWIIGEGGRLTQGALWVGGKRTTYAKDPNSGWLTFVVPQDAAGGPQFIGTQGPARQGLVLTVLPQEVAAQDVVVYISAARYADIQKQYNDRLKRLFDSCQNDCPKALLDTIQRLAALPFPETVPLIPKVQGGGTGGKLFAVPVQNVVLQATTAQVSTIQTPNLLRPNVKLSDLVRSINIDLLGTTRKTSFCDQLAGILPTSGLPTGQVIGLLNILFGGDLAVDPSGGFHPAQSNAPYKNEKPGTILNKFLGSPKGSGKGVTIHVLDTASATEDPFAMSSPVNYYNEIFNNRPYHGSIAGQVAQTLAPSARMDYQQVCDKTGNCSTLKTVQALCQVAAAARRGGKHVVSLSVGGSYPTLGVQWALREVAAAGVPTAASYGNRDDCAGHVPGDRCWHFPADWTGSFLLPGSRNTMLYSVAGWDIATLQMATYNRGVGNPGIMALPPSVQAPGEFWVNGFPYFGTSFSAPVVAGVLANWMACKPGVPFLPLVTMPGQLPLPASVVSACP